MHVDFRTLAGFGIAGNVANHLEQAGESEDFVDVKVDEEGAPKGIFPFYLPGHDSFLATFPISHDTIMTFPDENIQMEPEVGLLCDVIYEGDTVTGLTPKAFSAYNDCSIRKKGAKKISEKKNWGADTKGVSANFIEIDQFQAGGVMDNYRLASFIKRDGTLIAYGEDTELVGYTYFHQKLLDWIVGKFQTQTDHGPLEAIGNYLKQINNPSQILISIGATRYTEFGETHFLEPNDELFVVLYDITKESNESVTRALDEGTALDSSCSVLHQVVKNA